MKVLNTMGITYGRKENTSLGWDFCENKDCPRKRNQEQSL